MMERSDIRLALAVLAALCAIGIGIFGFVLAQSEPYAAVRVRKSVDNATPTAPLQTIEFTIEAVSTGTGTAANVVLQEILPPELEIPDGMAAFTTTGVYDPVSGQWRVGDLEPEQGELMTLPAIVVAEPQPPCIVNNVSMSIDDSRFVDNRASISIRRPGIENCADLEVSINPSSSVPRSCDRAGAVGYNFLIRNLGPDVARNVVLTVSEASSFKLPGFGFSASACEGLTCRWDEIQPGTREYVTATSTRFEIRHG